MQEPIVDHLKEWASDILDECSTDQVRSMIYRYRGRALDPAVDPFSRREFVLRADLLEEQLDTLPATADRLSPG